MMLYALLFAVAFDPVDSLPDALPDAAPIAKRTEPAPIIRDPLRILRYERQCTASGCVLVPVFAEVEPNIDTAAKRLRDWRSLPPDEVKRLAKIVDAPAVRKAIRQEYSVGTCGMICAAHGSVLYDVYDDGTKEPAAEQPAASTGGRGWYPGKIVGKVFGR